jgi:hypothetical protein
VHDFNLGINPYPSGFFWTMRIPDDSVTVHLGAGRASMRVSEQPALDFGKIPTAIMNGPSVASIVSYDVEWSGVIERSQIRDATQGFSGSFLTTSATINWSARHTNGDFTFQSDPTGQSTIFAEIGHERNGTFFP